MVIAIGGDSQTHLSDIVCKILTERKFELILCGALAGKQADYVDAALEVAEKVSSKECEKGILFCNTGTGVTIIANKVPGVRAALCVDEYTAKISRLANNANILVLGLRSTSELLAKEIVCTWLETEPSTEPRRIRFHHKTDEVDERFRKPFTSSLDS
ncbi:MAG: RpiB/LacA/LacB family sugar-phosphate isomerase [Sedimentisphaerales bacterium]|nr:RpiB/LacA/LacB family sugar-phosphate isomerase [Sedimentisphaerales bacterium]